MEGGEDGLTPHSFSVTEVAAWGPRTGEQENRSQTLPYVPWWLGAAMLPVLLPANIQVAMACTAG